MTNKQGILIGALGSYFNELIAENLRPIVERIDELESKALYQKGYSGGQALCLDELEKRLAKLEEKLDADFAWGRQAIHKIEELSELEKQGSLLRKGDRTCDHSARARDIAQEEIRKYIESDQFRRRIFDIVDMALQHTTLSIKGSE
jgi:hypothetical protein